MRPWIPRSQGRQRKRVRSWREFQSSIRGKAQRMGDCIDVGLRVVWLRGHGELQIAPGQNLQADKGPGNKTKGGVAQKKRRHGQIEEKKRRVEHHSGFKCQLRPAGPGGGTPRVDGEEYRN